MKIKKAKLEGAYRGVSAFFFCSSFLIFLLALSHSFLCYSLSHSFFTPLAYSFLCYSLSHSFFTPLSYSFLFYSLILFISLLLTISFLFYSLILFISLLAKETNQRKATRGKPSVTLSVGFPP
jgi:hypothetical protein